MPDTVRLRQPSGNAADGYLTMSTEPARIEMVDSGGSESLHFGAPHATGYFTVTLRHRTDLKADWQIVDANDGRVFQISSYGEPPNAPRHQLLKIFCTVIQ